jgi:hypothetical protein
VQPLLQCKSNNITYSEYVIVALLIQHKMRMCRIILSFVACRVLQYFTTLSHQRHDFRGGDLLNIKCLLIFSTNFV